MDNTASEKLLQKFSSYIRDGRDLRDIYQILVQLRALPEVVLTPLAADTNAEYSYTNKRISLDPERGFNPRSISHEYSHSLDDVMDQVYNRIHRKLQASPRLVTPQERQFYDGYLKLTPTASNLPIPWDDSYRSDPGELRAFGVANSAVQGPTAWSVPHLDATMAQEAAILRDLLKRQAK